MKIAILSFYSGHLERGVENWTRQIAGRLAKKHEVTVFQNGPKGSGLSYKVVSTNLKVDWKAKHSRGTLVRMVFVDYWSRLIALFTLKILPRLCEERFDLIVPTNGGWQVALMRLFTWVRGGKLVIVGHSGPGWDDRNNLWSFPNVFVALSSRAKKWAERANPFVRVVTIPNGVDLKRFRPEGEKVKIPLARPITLMVAAPEKGKRMELAIYAVAKLAKGSLLILGGGYEKERVRKLGKRLLRKRFLMKQVSFEKMPKYYRSADLFTLSSWKHEAFGIVYLEAMSSNLPVVATDDELRREIINDAGILVDPTDTDAYAEALRKALKTNWGNKPRKQAEKFSWDKVIRQYEKLFESLIK